MHSFIIITKNVRGKTNQLFETQTHYLVVENTSEKTKNDEQTIVDNSRLNYSIFNISQFIIHQSKYIFIYKNHRRCECDIQVWHGSSNSTRIHIYMHCRHIVRIAQWFAVWRRWLSGIKIVFDEICVWVVCLYTFRSSRCQNKMCSTFFLINCVVSQTIHTHTRIVFREQFGNYNKHDGGISREI